MGGGGGAVMAVCGMLDIKDPLLVIRLIKLQK